MILAELHLQNYKQYAGLHQIEFPSEGTVAVIGANGVGKTTLFEAIEWCLYNPREIPNDEVPPRGGIGNTRVKLVLEDPRDRARYVIERTRRRRGVEAEIYRQDQEGSPIVKGTRDVTEFVRHRLIGLSHRAFVSTFFTRQKELTFFGDLKETERRREVAQLLGFETIRSAQSIISEERTSARAEFQHLALQYEEERKDRDFAAEIDGADAAIEQATVAEQDAVMRTRVAESDHESARAELARWLEIERRDAELAREIERLTGDIRAAQAERRNAEENLSRLAALEADRNSLRPKAEAEPELRQALAASETDRDRFNRLQELTATVERGEETRNQVAQQARQTVGSAPDLAPPLEGWGWSSADERHLDRTISRLLSAVDRLDPAAEAAFSQRLQALLTAIDRRNQTRVKAERYRERLELRRQEEAELYADGDPRVHMQLAEQSLSHKRESAQNASQQAEQYVTRGREIERTIAAIRAASELPACPTCQRPLAPEDAELAIGPLQQQADELGRLGVEARHRHQVLVSEAAVAEVDLDNARSRVAALIQVESNIKNGTDLVEEVEDELRQVEEECRLGLDTLGLAAEPSRADVEKATKRADAAKAIAGQRRLLSHLQVQLRQAVQEAETAQCEIIALGPVSYDSDAHRHVEQAYNDARSAIARLVQIEQELKRRDQYEQQRKAAEAAVARASSELDELQHRRTALGFDPVALDQATKSEEQAATAARDADRTLSAAQATLQSAYQRRDALTKEHERIDLLARRSETRRREHDELDRMYREFGRFDQYVAQLVTPQLADYTGELLAEVTDHAYDQVLFDENYGIRVFDGDAHFPIEQFSGGERDVVSLCARLALSRFIGAQAAHPPQFLVLDEVFGSLDAERRSLVLNALLQLAGNDGPFRQLFIISHVDDIRSSPALDEAWVVREIDGMSKLENISRSGRIEEL